MKRGIDETVQGSQREKGNQEEHTTVIRHDNTKPGPKHETKDILNSQN